jgi:hypothetical protein
MCSDPLTAVKFGQPDERENLQFGLGLPFLGV